MASIYQEQCSQNDSISKSESTCRIKSTTTSMASYSSNIAQMVKVQLLKYKDITDEQFIIIPNEAEPNVQKNSEFNSYMNQHTTEIPIGPNYQAQIPHLLSSSVYRQKNPNRDPLCQLSKIKIHSPQKDNKFYQDNKEIIQEIFGIRSYQEVIHMKHCWQNTEFWDFYSYLKNREIFQFWNQYFLGRGKMGMKAKKKKRRYK